jgi:hypothetical protein
VVGAVVLALVAFGVYRIRKRRLKSDAGGTTAPMGHDSAMGSSSAAVVGLVTARAGAARGAESPRPAATTGPATVDTSDVTMDRPRAATLRSEGSAASVVEPLPENWVAYESAEGERRHCRGR